MSKRNGPTFCWVCNRNLMIATTGEWEGHRVWSVDDDMEELERDRDEIEKRLEQARYVAQHAELRRQVKP